MPWFTYSVCWCRSAAAQATAVVWCRLCRDEQQVIVWQDVAPSKLRPEMSGMEESWCLSTSWHFRTCFPSCFPPFALSVVPSFVSEQGCDPVWRDGLLGFLWSIFWKITAQAAFEETSSHHIDPCLYFFCPPPHPTPPSTACLSLALLNPVLPVSGAFSHIIFSPSLCHHVLPFVQFLSPSIYQHACISTGSYVSL